jgi:hypothetical protein
MSSGMKLLHPGQAFLLDQLHVSLKVGSSRVSNLSAEDNIASYVRNKTSKRGLIHFSVVVDGESPVTSNGHDEN